MKIVHASISENHNDGWDGKAKKGDQTGKEVFVKDWYSKPWNVMLRYKNRSIARKVADIAVKLANSNLVGYDQSERNSLYKALKNNGWDVDKYISSGKKTECDCSSFIYACYCCLVENMRFDINAPVTADMQSFYTNFGFTAYTSTKYVSEPNNLRIGDILVKRGSHTVMAIEDGVNVLSTTETNVKASTGADYFDYTIAGEYKATTDLYLRNGANTEEKVLTVIPEGYSVRNYGFYSLNKDIKWLYVETIINGCKYTGFSSSKYLKKV